MSKLLQNLPNKYKFQDVLLIDNSLPVTAV